MSEQNFKNHVKFAPAFHYFAMPVLVLNFFWMVSRLRYGITRHGVADVLVAAALVVLLFCARLFALKAQDRIIRLEERLRYERLLPADLKARSGELTVDQIVALRFAGDDELPALARKVLDEKIGDRTAIKKLVQHWRADHLRV
jgi:hypothetical protein